MKKSYLMIAAAAALFAACAQNDVINEIVQEDEAIGFNGAFVGKTTRADITKDYLETVEPTNTAYNDFGVFGYKASSSNFQLFNNEQVIYQQVTAATTYSAAEAEEYNTTNGLNSGDPGYKSEGDPKPAVNDWRHSTVRFWDKSATYTFLAYAPYGAYNATVGVTAQPAYGLSFSGIPVITQIADNHIDDLVVSDAIVGQSYADCTNHSGLNHISQHGTENKYTYVPLTFNHILSKLTFKAKSSATSNSAKIRISQIKIDFPTDASNNIEWKQDLTDNVTPLGATTIPTLTAQDAVDTTTGAIIDDNNFGFTVFNVTGSGRYGTNWLTATAQDIVEWSWTDAQTPDQDNSATYTSEEYIVAPVEEGSGEGVTTGYDFAIKVVYDIQYYKYENSAWVVDGDPEIGCVATGIIPATVYMPNENQLWTIVIDVNPEQINFCVKAVNDWVDDFDNDGDVEEHYVIGTVQ